MLHGGLNNKIYFLNVVLLSDSTALKSPVVPVCQATEKYIGVIINALGEHLQPAMDPFI